MLCDYVTRGYGDHPPLTIAASVERRRRSAWGGAAVVRPVQRGGGPGPGLVAPEDVGPAEAETVILPRTPDEPLVVDVARGLDGGSMMEQTHRIRMQASCSVSDYRECVCVFITGEGESQNKGKQIWSYEERRRLPEEGANRALMRLGATRSAFD